MLEKLDYLHGALEEADECLLGSVGMYGKDETRAWIWAALTELEELRLFAEADAEERHELIMEDHEQRVAARWPRATVAEGTPTKEVCDWCGLRFKPTSFDRATCCCVNERPQTVQQCEAMTLIQCRTCYEVNERDCCGYENRMREARELEWATEEAAREPREAK